MGPGMMQLIRMPRFRRGRRAAGHVGPHLLLARQVAHPLVLLAPRRGLVEVVDLEELEDRVEVGLPAHAGGRGDHPDRGAAGEGVLLEQPVDHVPVADEVDLLDPRRALGDTGAGEQRVDRSAALFDGGIDRGLVGEVELDGLDAVERHVGAIHHDDLGPGVLDQLRRWPRPCRWPHRRPRLACRRSGTHRRVSCRAGLLVQRW